MKTTNKLAILLGIVCISLVVAFGSIIYYIFDKYSYVDFYKRLETRVSISARYNLGNDTTNAENLKLLKKQHLEQLENEHEYLIPFSAGMSVVDTAQKYNLPTGFLKEINSKGKAQAKSGNTFFAGSIHSNKKTGNQYYVIVSAGNYYVSHHLLFLRNIIIVGVVLTLLIVLSFSIYFSKHIFDPIREITLKVKKISTENIHHRLSSDNYKSSNEIAELANTFNDLLSRVETAFEIQKNFISNASHELRTPLTSIIGEADVSLLKTRTPEEYQKSLQNVLQQAERLDQISKSLLFLAQTGYKGNAIVFEMVRVDEVIWQTKGLIDKINPANQILVDLSLVPEDPKKLKINGNVQLLHLAFSNILSNACKYSNNSPVTVFIASSNAHVIVTIKDKGIGIPETDLPHIYDPFFRASNTKMFEGYGIGLPLARNVINLHKGMLTVDSKVNVHTTVQIKIPLFKV
ncbi:MAG: HAMP domain-containing histidine kinase [Sphingobacteriales bacterium JAD_PAG50586_3]|nr:MAG: HAMP domain-containing histidine kinase [Sphingobacteriales bacterium JAD_PAG50586_3]